MASADDMKITVDLSHTPPVERLLREHAELLAALKFIVFESCNCESYNNAKELIARIEKPDVAVETRSRFLCKECGFEHLGGEPCCGHGEACVEVER